MEGLSEEVAFEPDGKKTRGSLTWLQVEGRTSLPAQEAWLVDGRLCAAPSAVCVLAKPGNTPTKS